MTREEAIDELKYLAACSYVDEFEPTEKEALKMAIEALRQLTSYEHTIIKLIKIIKENTICQDVIRLCKSFEYCTNKCPLYDDAVNVGACLFSYDPCDWDIKRIEEAMRKDENYEGN